MPTVVSPMVICAIAGLVCLLAGRRAALLTKLVAALGAALAFALGLRLFGSGAAYARDLFSIADLQISLAFKVGAFSSFVGAFVGFFGLVTVAYSLTSVPGEQDLGRFFAYLLWAIGGSFGVVYADHFLLFVIFWEIVTVMLFLLVNLGGLGSKFAAGKAFTILGLSDGALLLGVILLWARTGNLVMTGTHIAAHDGMTYAIFILLTVAALAKAGAFPVHTWIPAIAEPTPAPVMAFLPAAVDKLLGIYLLARVSVEMFEPSASMSLLLMFVGAVTIVGAVLMAMVQHNLKKLLSFHAVSQVGYMVLGIGTGSIIGIMGGIFHMVNHAVYKSCLFFGGGAVEKKAGTTELDELGGLARVMPVTFVSMLVAALSISGVPPFNGFASKWMIYQGILGIKSNLMPVFLTAAIFGSALTLASFVKVIHSVFWQSRPKALEGLRAGEPSYMMAVPVAILAAICVIFGVFVRLPVGGLLTPSLAEMGKETSVEGGVGLAIWNPTMATGLIIVGLLIGVIMYFVGRAVRFRTVPVFVGGERIESEETRVSGTGFYETIRELPFFSTIYRDAESSVFDIYYLGGRIGSGIVGLLRMLHNGILTTYMSWVALGLAAIGALITYLIRLRG